jgi:hypothetical protein
MTAETGYGFLRGGSTNMLQRVSISRERVQILQVPSRKCSNTFGFTVHFMSMSLRIRLCAVATLLALLSAPGLSCFVPQQLLGADQQECCRQMGSQCGSKEMSSPQSCCKSPSQQSVQPYTGSVEHSRVATVPVVTAFLQAGPIPIPAVTGPALTISRFHSPPLSLSETNSILRI